MNKYMSNVELEIVGELIDRTLQVPSHQIYIYNGGDEPEVGPSRDKAKIIEAMAQSGTDEFIVREGKHRVGWISLVYGNDEDLVSDYIDNVTTRAIVGW